MKKQLNNNLGHIARIVQIDNIRNEIVYEVYETIIIDKNSVEIEKVLLSSQRYSFKTVNINQLLSTEINVYNKCIETLQSEVLIDYQIADEGHNWLFPDKVLCLAINNVDNLKEISMNVDYYDLIQRIMTNIPTRIVQNKYALIYCNTIENSDLPIVIDFLDKWIFVQPQTILNLNLV